MSTSLRSLVIRQYRARLRALRDQIIAQAQAIYGDLDPEAIDESFRAIAPQITRFLEAGKGSAASLSAAFLDQLAVYEGGQSLDTPRPPVATAKSGLPLAEALRNYVVPAVLGAIGSGRPLDLAVGYGAFLLAQFTDNEILRTADETVAASREMPHYAGWEGEVAAGACANCVDANTGRHGPSEPLYRHGFCRCEEIPIFEGTYTAPELVPA